MKNRTLLILISIFLGIASPVAIALHLSPLIVKISLVPTILGMFLYWVVMNGREHVLGPALSKWATKE